VPSRALPLPRGSARRPCRCRRAPYRRMRCGRSPGTCGTRAAAAPRHLMRRAPACAAPPLRVTGGRYDIGGAGLAEKHFPAGWGRRAMPAVPAMMASFHHTSVVQLTDQHVGHDIAETADASPRSPSDRHVTRPDRSPTCCSTCPSPAVARCCYRFLVLPRHGMCRVHCG